MSSNYRHTGTHTYTRTCIHTYNAFWRSPYIRAGQGVISRAWLAALKLPRYRRCMDQICLSLAVGPELVLMGSDQALTRTGGRVMVINERRWLSIIRFGLWTFLLDVETPDGGHGVIVMMMSSVPWYGLHNVWRTRAGALGHPWDGVVVHSLEKAA